MEKPKYPIKDYNQFYKEYIETILHTKYFVYPNARDYIEDDLVEQYLDENPNTPCDINGIPLNMPNFYDWNYESDIFSLQEILDSVPKDVDPTNVVIKIERDRQLNYIIIKVIKKIKNTLTEDEFEESIKDQEEEWKQRFLEYEKQLKKYELYIKELEIENLQRELNLLKKK